MESKGVVSFRKAVRPTSSGLAVCFSFTARCFRAAKPHREAPRFQRLTPRSSQWLLCVLLIVSWVSLTAAACDLYPIAVSMESLRGVTSGQVIEDVFNGTEPGNFGWLTWAGSPSVPTLVKSLTAPGDSGSYVNPDRPEDHQVSLDDWVRGKPGVSNSRKVREALDHLLGQEVVLPVWDVVRGGGEKAEYHVAAFARLQLLGYELPHRNRLSARFVGYTSCGDENQAPVVDAGADRTVVVNEPVALHGLVTDDGLPAPSRLFFSWACIGGPSPVAFENGEQAESTAIFTNAGIYRLQLVAADWELASSDEVTITVDLPNHPPRAIAQSLTTPEDEELDLVLSGEDDDGDALSFEVAGGPFYGVLAGSPPRLRYVPKSDFNGADSFTFRVNDGQLDSAPATVSITINAVNDAPVADSLSVTNGEDQPVEFVLSGSDLEGTDLTFRITDGPAHGQLSGTAPQLSYWPDPDYFGPDELSYVASDGSLESAPAQVFFHVMPVNDPPRVTAGSDRLINWPLSEVNLAGTVEDDGEPFGPLSVWWTCMDGPGEVSFSAGNQLETAASFEKPGIYHLRLSATDTLATNSAETTVVINQPPSVEAGKDQVVLLGESASLAGLAEDDELPAGVLDMAWSVVSGPGAAAFEDGRSLATMVTFSAIGTYQLRLSASDGAAVASDEMTVTVRPLNQPPVVDAGHNQMVVLPDLCQLKGVVTDDGWPSHVLTVRWRQIDGPGPVAFDAPNSARTTAAFSDPGNYVLELSADDSEFTRSARVTIVVAGGGSERAALGRGRSGSGGRVDERSDIAGKDRGRRSAGGQPVGRVLGGVEWSGRSAI